MLRNNRVESSPVEILKELYDVIGTAGAKRKGKDLGLL